MLIERVSPLTGKKNTMRIPVTQEEIDYWHVSGRSVQSVFPDLTADQREFLMTGLTPEDWDEMFNEDRE
jgi:hypothetical protein